MYSPRIYNQLKARLQDSGLSSLGNTEIITLFSPWYAEHLGHILPASGNATLAQWAKSALSVTSYFFTYTSLLKLRSNNTLLRELDTLLGNEAVLQLNLRTLEPIFQDQSKRDWFVEVLDNNLKLWEVNMDMVNMVNKQKWHALLCGSTIYWATHNSSRLPMPTWFLHVHYVDLIIWNLWYKNIYKMNSHFHILHWIKVVGENFWVGIYYDKFYETNTYYTSCLWLLAYLSIRNSVMCTRIGRELNSPRSSEICVNLRMFF